MQEDYRKSIDFEYRFVDSGGVYHVEKRRTTKRWYDSLIGSPFWVLASYPTVKRDEARLAFDRLSEPLPPAFV